MSRTSKKCNELCNKIQSISGLDDNYVYGKLLQLEYAVNNIIDACDKYADEEPLNGVGENARTLLQILQKKYTKKQKTTNENKTKQK